ncbi:MAG: hypothetical protein U1E36_06750 [Rickettsiales bacterium]
MAPSLKLALIQDNEHPKQGEQYEHNVFSFIGISPEGGFARISLNPYRLEEMYDGIKSGYKKLGKKFTPSPAEQLLLQLVEQLKPESNPEIRTALKRKFDAIYAFAVPEQPAPEISFEEGQKEARKWMRNIGYHQIASDYSNLKKMGSTDKNGNILTAFSRENEAYYSNATREAFPWRQRDAIKFFLNRLNTQMEALSCGKKPIYALHDHLNADIAREFEGQSKWCEKERKRQSKFKGINFCSIE